MMEPIGEGRNHRADLAGPGGAALPRNAPCRLPERGTRAAGPDETRRSEPDGFEAPP